ncbi:DUF881 domain-containing protein [Nocardioides gilvus]|uniref:DUF881 domain-containing protein n=1 Tax=Nocardioides gilvus TaxID=1735589 RepID=UPI000D74B080|nr:DUF881 domain-containing protein [Nocardioides gilvus]
MSHDEYLAGTERSGGPDAEPAEQSSVPPTGAADRARLPDHVTMPLLSLVTQQSLDLDYRHVADRRAAAGTSAAPTTGRRLAIVTAVVVAMLGSLIAVAAVQTSQQADVRALGKAGLVERIQLEKESVRELQNRAGALRDENAASEGALRELRERESSLTARVSRLGARNGYLAVRGPGLRIVVDDAPGGGPNSEVRDEDLVLLVDGLWAAGAEAISINGQRLTVLSSIQNSGSAIHVNVRPLNPPYVVEGIGDPDTLEGRLLASANGSLFYGVARTLGFVFQLEDVDTLELPAARVRPLRSAVSADKAD